VLEQGEVDIRYSNMTFERLRQLSDDQPGVADSDGSPGSAARREAWWTWLGQPATQPTGKLVQRRNNYKDHGDDRE
jgi:hypothetical protein